MLRCSFQTVTRRWLSSSFHSRVQQRYVSSNAIEDNEKRVLVVESPAKARKIQELLGERFMVLASYGHVRDLPPKPGSVMPDQAFKMIWEPIKDAEKHLIALEAAVNGASQLILGTDPDREGEAISWHIIQELRKKGVIHSSMPLCRIQFTEITERAIWDAVNNPRTIDQSLVNAYLARRALDYLFGFHLSPILWRKLPGANSAGRVQSSVLKVICDREEEIERFEPSEFWTVDTKMVLQNGIQVPGELLRVDSHPVPIPGYDDEKYAFDICQWIKISEFKVKSVTSGFSTRDPQPPFTTSTLQQEANKKLGFSSSRTMQLAQQLYESGWITYMRTDSPTIGAEAIACIRESISSILGSEYLPRQPRLYKAKQKNAQESHEAIRITNIEAPVHLLAGQGFDSSSLDLYSLIRDRTLSSQCKSAEVERITVIFENQDGTLELKAKSSRIQFPGFLKILKDQNEYLDRSSNTFESLHCLEIGDAVEVASSDPVEHQTKPPPRYNEGSIIKEMENLGIGRPSTYAPTIKLLQARGYIKSVKKQLHVEPLGRILTMFLQSYMPDFVDCHFTSKMEDKFDRISNGSIEWKTVVREFWDSFDESLKSVSDLQATEIIHRLNEGLRKYLFESSFDDKGNTMLKGDLCPLCGKALSVKMSHKGGPFIGCSNYPECTYTRSILTLNEHIPISEDDIGQTFKSMNVAEKYGMRGSVRLLGSDPATGREIFVRQGPYGPYIQYGTDKDHDMKRVPLPKDSKPRSLTLKYALSMLALPRTLGAHPETGLTVEVRNGKFGPFIIHQSQMRSIPKDVNPLEMTLEEGLDLLRLSDSKKKGKITDGSTSHRDSLSIEGKASISLQTDTKILEVPRARSAYQFFLKENLSDLKIKLKGTKMKALGERWRSLTTEEKAIFQRRAEEDNLRVRIQCAGLMEPSIESWESLSDSSKRNLHVQLVDMVQKGDSKGSLNSLKRPKTPYTIFMREVSDSMKKGEMDRPQRGTFMTEVAKRWRELSEAERQIYEDQAEREQEEYLRKVSKSKNFSRNI